MALAYFPLVPSARDSLSIRFHTIAQSEIKKREENVKTTAKLEISSWWSKMLPGTTAKEQSGQDSLYRAEHVNIFHG